LRHIAIVPARAGSKGVPGKNLKAIGGQTLTHRAIHAALSSKIFEQVILTTDIPLFLEEEPNGWTIHPRPEHLAQDSTPMAEVVLDALKPSVPDETLIWLLQPTSPFREANHFHQIVEIFKAQSPGSVIGVTPVGDSHPSRHYKLSTYQDLVPLFPKFASFDNRQNLKPVYERNGMYYVTSARAFREKKTFFVPKCKPFLVDRLRSFNINDELDFRMAQTVSQWI
jgi:CMP-N-acetylneuraminic acid synthetase